MARRQRAGVVQAGFTFIEILITISVVAVLFVPVMQLFSNSMFATDDNLELITATNLAKSEMERTINLNLTKEQLKQMGSQTFPPANQKPYVVNRSEWRVRREIVDHTDPVEVRVKVFKENKPEKPVVELVTLVEDLMWSSVTPVGTGESQS